MAKIKTGQLILAAVLAIFVYGMVAAMLGTILPAFHFTPEQTGNIALAQALGLVLASLAGGPLVDFRGKKLSLVIGLVLIALALFLLANSGGEYSRVMVDLFLLGLGAGVLVTATNALASDVNEERRAATLNFLNLFFGLGGLATPFIAANVLRGNPVLIAYAAAILTFLVAAVHFVIPMPPPSRQSAFQLAEAGAVMRRPALWLFSLLFFLYVACEAGVWNWLAKFLISPPNNLPERTALNILSLGFALGLLVGRVVVVPIVLRIPALTVTLAASVLMALTTYWMLHSTGITGVASAVFCSGAAMAPVFPTTLAMVGDAFPVMRASALGVVITSGWLGLAVSSPLIGWIAGGDDGQLGAALLVLPAASIGMILVSLALRPMVAERDYRTSAAASSLK